MSEDCNPGDSDIRTVLLCRRNAAECRRMSPNIARLAGLCATRVSECSTYAAGAPPLCRIVWSMMEGLQHKGCGVCWNSDELFHNAAECHRMSHYCSAVPQHVAGTVWEQPMGRRFCLMLPARSQRPQITPPAGASATCKAESTKAAAPDRPPGRPPQRPPDSAAPPHR